LSTLRKTKDYSNQLADIDRLVFVFPEWEHGMLDHVGLEADVNR